MKSKANIITGIILSTMFFIVSGCTGRSSTPNYIAHSPLSGAKNAIIVADARIGEGNLQSYLLACYTNKDLVGMQGPLRDKAAKFWSAHHHVQYVEMGEGRGSFLLWELPLRAFSTQGANVMFYLACVGNEKDVFFYWDGYADLGLLSRPRYMGLFPLIGTWNSAYDSRKSPHTNHAAPVVDFDACIFSIDTPSIYYLGEIQTEGSLSEVDSGGIVNFGWETLQAKVKTRITKDMGRLQRYLASKNLSGRDIIDLSGEWRTHPIMKYYAMTRQSE